MRLLIDIGNSRLKWTLEAAGQFEPLRSIDYRHNDQYQDLCQSWQQLPRPAQILIACVGAQQQLATIVEAAEQLWPGVEIRIPESVASAGGVSNGYLQPAQLGVDRWLALLAAHRHYPGNSCIVDCGTAITLDRLDAQGRHLGGLIAPGLHLMKQALAGNTAGLRWAESAKPVPAADNTQSAIDSGCLWAAAGLIESSLAQGEAIDQLILTGGDSTRIGQLLSQPFIIDLELVFKGLVCAVTD